ncbi:MAG TPA: vWA domain-containing protein, partial [Blastocatellia bacterium]|nr:vWA domain-containing protein [Blastocatellia bacterium]
MPRAQQAQDECAQPSESKCFTRSQRDIAFLIDATGSVEQRGQTYNIQVEGVRRAISDPTVIPRDGSVAVAVIVFNEAAQVAVPLTDVTSEAVAQQIAAAVESLKCSDIHSHIFPCPFGATLYAPAIQAADIHVSRVRNLSPKPGVTRAFVLSSDGLTNDLGAAIKQVETARVASVQANIPFELDFIVLGESQQSPDFSTALGTANELVTPKPTNDLPGESFVVAAGTANVEGASPTDPDAARQANDFAETVRQIVRGQVTAV